VLGRPRKTISARIAAAYQEVTMNSRERVPPRELRADREETSLHSI
jgi:hypothetical protein